MIKNASHFSTGDITQVNAEHYQNHGTTSNAVTVNSGGQYTPQFEINANEYQYHHHEAPASTPSSDPLKDLAAHIVVGAMHDSGDRVDAPKCHKDTREAVQQDILSCLAQPDDPEGLVWLTGPAGAGKTAIMGTICDRLKKTNRLAATFYFSSHKGSEDRGSKQFFVTSLAYQLQQHPALKGRISPAMMLKIQQDPAIFKMSLSEQAEVLLLRPLRDSGGPQQTTSGPPLVIAIDGVDECGEARYDKPNRSREKDQVEVLSVLLQAFQDPAFPCRIIIASRPETWIRRFFKESAPVLVTEIFLDKRYSPDKDIELFFKSKFSELSRRCGYDSSAWPKQQDIEKLVVDASGQFIYAATILRFIDSPGAFPKDQLDIVLKIRPPAGASPFRTLDALYTAILKLGPRPAESVLWLKAISHIGKFGSTFTVTAWTIDRLFESHEGQAQTVVRVLPSLLHLTEPTDGKDSDMVIYAERSGMSIHLADCKSAYSFYHKSFLDFLEDPARSGDAFPEVGHAEVRQWIWGQIAKVLELNGPEVPMDSALLQVFKMCIINVLANEFEQSEGHIVLPQDALSQSNPTLWLEAVINTMPCRMFIIVHKECRPYSPCSAGCKRWRKAISRLPPHKWHYGRWGFGTLLLDQFCIKRIKK